MAREYKRAVCSCVFLQHITRLKLKAIKMDLATLQIAQDQQMITTWRTPKVGGGFNYVVDPTYARCLNSHSSSNSDSVGGTSKLKCAFSAAKLEGNVSVLTGVMLPRGIIAVNVEHRGTNLSQNHVLLI